MPKHGLRAIKAIIVGIEARNSTRNVKPARLRMSVNFAFARLSGEAIASFGTRFRGEGNWPCYRMLKSSDA